MIIKGADLNNREKAMFALRALYSSHGFQMFRMSKFETFELYAGYRDFMDAASIITFTDTDGVLMALKPDVTLSIVKNNRHIGNDIRKLYYTENVYRVSPKTHYFKEIMQTGLECLGQIDENCICEVLQLAAESLRVLSEKSMLDISNLDILSQLLKESRASAEAEIQIMKCISEKNIHSLERVCEEAEIRKEYIELFCKLVSIYGKPEKAIPELEAAFGKTEPESGYRKSIQLLKNVVKSFEGSGLKEILNIDFSVINDLKYYNGIVFKGFIEGVPDGVLSGGQYNRLMVKMNRKSQALGFAVYMDDLGKLSKFDGEEIVIHG